MDNPLSLFHPLIRQWFRRGTDRTVAITVVISFKARAPG